MRKILSRLLLAALVAAGLFAIVRLVDGTSHPADVVHLERLHAEELQHVAFSVGEGGARVAVHTVGSFEGLGDTLTVPAVPPLAAYGWLVRRADGAAGDAVAWRPQPRRRPARGSVFSVRDTVALAPGVYDAYFASFGDPLVRAAAPASRRLGDRVRAALSRGGRAWLGESDRWRLVVSGATTADRGALQRLDDEDEREATPGAVWTSGPVGSGATEEGVLRVDAATRVRLRATTEVTDGVVADSASVVRLDDGATVWHVDAARGRWAGGSLKNQAYDTTLVLAPGLYRVRFATDRSHAYGDWTANPPFAPTAWGLRVDAAPGARVALFHPDADGVASLPEIARVDCEGPDRDDAVAFTLGAPVTAVIVATGEMSSSSSRYDFATLEYRADAQNVGDAVWDMDYDRSEHAGGADRNRRETAVLTLAPGRYTLRYQTDDSHDCADGFGDGGPDDGQWGVVLAAISPGFEEESVRRHEPPVIVPEPGERNATRHRPLASLVGLGPDADVRASFTLDEPSVVRIMAVGELLPSERLDWGWIEDESGETVWEMTRDNTTPAGGAAKNRRFDRILALEAGTFTVRFRTNDRHDAADFDRGDAPRDPSAWGIRVEQPTPPDED